MNANKGTGDAWTVRDILNWTTKRFVELELPTPLLDAQLLLSHVLGFSKIQLYTQIDRPLSADERVAMRDLVKRHVQGEPVAYLLNQKHWHDLDLMVDKRVLIPRPETETLLDFVLSVWRQANKSPEVIFDFCTGSGCLAIALARAFPEARVLAIDISEEALEVARANAQRNGVPQLECLLGDLSRPPLYEYLLKTCGPADIIVANPPYVTEDEWMRCDISVKDFEPRLALVAAEQGLALSRQIAVQVMRTELLSRQSVFAMETGVGHPRALVERLTGEGSAVAKSETQAESFSAQVHAWKLPRNEFFCARDLEEKDRFLCRISGLDFAAATVDLETVGDLNANVVEP